MRTVEVDVKDPIQALRLQRFAEKTNRTLSEAVEFFLEQRVAPYLAGEVRELDKVQTNNTTGGCPCR